MATLVWTLLAIVLAGCGAGPSSATATPRIIAPTPTATSAPVITSTPFASPTPLAARVLSATATATTAPTATATATAAPVGTVNFTTPGAAQTANAPKATVAAGQAVTITASGSANVRSAPDTSASVVTQVPEGTDATLLAADVAGTDGSSRWVQVSYNGATGYIRNDLVSSPHAMSAVQPTATRPAATATTAQTPAPAAYQLAASVSNAAPTQNTRVTVTARLTNGGTGVAGATMHTSWDYKTTVSTCDGGPSGADGVMSCTRDISRATKGFTVTIDVTVTYQGKAYRTSTGFTTR